MLTGKQKRFLRHEAHHLNAIFQIEIAQELSLKTDAEVVQILGRTIILYRESEKEIYRLP